LNSEKLATLVKQHALALGFDTVGITDLGPTPHADTLREWLSRNMAGTMRYMHRQEKYRAQPASIVPNTSRAIVLTRGYFNSNGRQPVGTGRVAKYARGADYHDTLRQPLEDLASYVRSLGGPDTIARSFVDAGPVPERELAQRAGLGWIGKNTMLIAPTRGSFFFLAAVFTNLDLAIDDPFEADRCGSCTRCLDACPTTAFDRERLLDSRRCISYLTIEFGGEIATELRALMGDWIFGCDICQDVCPWNAKFASVRQDRELGLDPSRAFEDLGSLIEIEDAEFRRRFGWTPLDRPGVVGVRRNAVIAAENSKRGDSCRTSQTQ